MRERVEEIDPHALGRPADVAIVKRLLRSIDRRRNDPASAGFEHMNDPADHPAIINARLDPRVSRIIRQPKKSRIINSLLSEVLNHKLKPFGTLWVRSLASKAA